MHHKRLGRVTLQILKDDLLRLPIDGQLQNVGIERLVVQLTDQFIVSQRDHDRILVSPVNDPGNQTGMTQAAARTLTRVTARLRINIKVFAHDFLQIIVVEKSLPYRDQYGSDG
jgi:hypothetical protein